MKIIYLLQDNIDCILVEHYEDIKGEIFFTDEYFIANLSGRNFGENYLKQLDDLSDDGSIYFSWAADTKIIDLKLKDYKYIKLLYNENI